VHIKIDETIALSTSRDGGMESMEVKGIMMLLVVYVLPPQSSLPPFHPCSRHLYPFLHQPI
jgi:hypothetical protein